MEIKQVSCNSHQQLVMCVNESCMDDVNGNSSSHVSIKVVCFIDILTWNCPLLQVSVAVLEGKATVKQAMKHFLFSYAGMFSYAGVFSYASMLAMQVCSLTWEARSGNSGAFSLGWLLDL